PPLGAVRPLGEGCAGRAILAHLAPESAEAFAAWARRQGVRAADARSFARDLAEIRRRGFAAEETPVARGRAALALPLRAAGAARDRERRAGGRSRPPGRARGPAALARDRALGRAPRGGAARPVRGSLRPPGSRCDRAGVNACND